MFKKSLMALVVAGVLSGCGSDGKDGLNGAAGPQGPQGETGALGQTGPQGETGAQGQNGAQGEAGQSAAREVALKVVGRFATGIYGKSAAEIVQFHQASKSAFAINGALNRIEVIPLAGLSDEAVAMPVADESLHSTAFEYGPVVTVAGNRQITVGATDSIAIHDNLLAIAVAAENKTDNGAVLFYRLDSAGAGTFIKAVEVGALPDMVTFTHSGSKVLVANEGEPAIDYSKDPEGSISVIAVSGGMPADSASTINFTSDLRFGSDLIAAEDYDTEQERRALLQGQGVKFASVPGTTVAQDLEPEYIAVAADDSKAYVSLQENNALGIIDLENNTSEVRALGLKDWSKYRLDYTNKDEMPSLRSVERLYGLYQPDTIATFEYQGATFVLSANEGDSRDWHYKTDEATCTAAGHTYDDGDCISYSEEVRVKDLKDNFTEALMQVYDANGGKNGLGRLKVTKALGMIDTNNDGVADKYDALYAYGARSFSIWDQNANLVFDSGDDFERIGAAIQGNNFNSAHTENKGDNRSDDKGGEPEAIAVGTINGHRYAFIGLERSGDLFAYDISNPFNAGYAGYYNNRDFNTTFEMDDDLADPCSVAEGMDCTQVPVSGDLGPESIQFVPAADSPNGNPLLIIGNEVSGTVTVYQVNEK